MRVGDRQADRLTGPAGSCCHHSATGVGGNHDRALVGGAGHSRGDSQTGEVRGDVELVDVCGAHRFQPHRLPDTRGAGVEDAGRVVALLADGKRVGFVAILDLHGDHLRTGPAQRLGDVRTELGVATLVMSHLLAVHPYGGDLVDGAEMQQYVAPQPVGRQLENLAVPHLVVVARDAGQRRLHRVGHQDLLAVGARRRRCRKDRTR